MDISGFINSRDIRKYHRDIGYEYNALEAAWLVSQCHCKTLKQKHEAWQWIIDNMPDMEVKDCGRWGSNFNDDSIHKLLKEYMDMDNAFIKDFQDNSGGYFYKFRRYSHSVKRCGAVSDYEGFFSSWDKCLKYIFDNEDAEDAAFYEISRRKPDEPDDRIIHGSIEIDIAGQILDVSAAYEKEENERWFYLDTFFDELWFSFPVPFKRGDIVSLRSRYHPEDREPVVIDDIIVPNGWDEEEYIKKRMEYGDTSDMNIWGYAADTEWVSGYRGAYREVWDSYMDAEYYRDELEGYNRVLKPISSWLKGEFNDELDLLLAGYHHIMMEEYLKRTVPVLYTKEGLKLAGFRRQKNNGKKDLEKTNYISQEMLLDFVFNVISEVNYSLIKYDVEVKCMDFKVVDDEWFDMDIIDSNNATLGMKIRIAGMSPKALQKKQEAVSSVISASYNDLYMLLIEGKWMA